MFKIGSKRKCLAPPGNGEQILHEQHSDLPPTLHQWYSPKDGDSVNRGYCVQTTEGLYIVMFYGFLSCWDRIISFAKILKFLFFLYVEWLYSDFWSGQVQSHFGFPHTPVEVFTFLTCSFLGVAFHVCWLVVLFSTSQVWPEIVALRIHCCWIRLVV